MKGGWRNALGLVVSAGFLVWALRGVEFAVVWERLRTANLPLFFLSAFLATVIFAIRALKWRVILDPVAPALPFGPLWRATTIGMMINNLVPARVGEIARAYVLTRERREVRFTASVASLAVDRIFDAAVLFTLLFLAMLDPRFPTGAAQAEKVRGGAGFAVVLMFVGLAGLYALATKPERFERWLAGLLRAVAPRFEPKALEMLHQFSSGLGVLRSPRRFALVLGWTVLHWLVNAAAFSLGFEAVGIEVPFTAALFLQGVIAIGVAIPSSPGFFGVFEAFAIVGLGVYGIANDLAVTWAIGFHLLSFIPITLIGAWYFSRLGLSLGELGNRSAEPEPSR